MAIDWRGFDESQATVLINGVPCAELVRDYEEGADDGQAFATKSYCCLWSKRFFVANAVLGLTTVSGGPDGKMTFNHPLQHPDIRGIYTRSVHITGLGRPSQGPGNVAFTAAKITIGFKAYPWNFQPSDDPGNNNQIDPATPLVYATQDIDQGEESVEWPGSALMYPGNRPIQKTMSIPMAHAVMRITFMRMPYLPVATLPYFNNVNSIPFLGCARGTCRFKGSQTHRSFQIDANSQNSVSQDVTNTYEYRPAAEWNLFPNPDPATATAGTIFVPIKRADGTAIFPYTDLAANTLPNPAYLGGG